MSINLKSNRDFQVGLTQTADYKDRKFSLAKEGRGGQTDSRHKRGLMCLCWFEGGGGHVRRNANSPKFLRDTLK